MKNLWFLFLLFAATAYGGVESSVVRVMSYPCDRPQMAKFGSGSLIAANGSIFVLTSDHVLFHGDAAEGVCHRANAQDWQKETEIHLVMVNFAKGLGLLMLPNPSPAVVAAAIPIESLRAQASSPVSGFGSLVGYPFHSLSVLKDSNAQVMSPDSDRVILPLVESVIEVNGHNEYGMSGGGFFDDQNRYRGLLSHQYLQLVEGQPSQLVETDEGMTGGQLIGLVIPLSTVLPWLDSYFQQKTGQDVRWSLDSQLRGRPAAVFDNVRFTPRDCPPPPNRGRHGLHALHDPVGIGGDVTVVGNICSVVLTLETPGAVTQAWPFLPSSQLTKARDRLLAGDRAIISGLYYQGSSFPIETLLNLFAKMQAGVSPIIQISDPFGDSDQAVKSLLAAVGPSRTDIDGLTKAFPDDRQVAVFLGGISETLRLVEAKNFDLIDSGDYAKMLNDPMWSTLLIDQWTLASDLKTQLIQIQNLLSKISL